MTEIKVTKVNGEFSEITVNGKALAKPKINLLNKALKTGYFRMYEGDAEAFNPFSGASITLNALAFSVYQWCNIWYERYSMRGVEYAKAPIQTYDRMKYFIDELNPGAYSILID